MANVLTISGDEQIEDKSSMIEYSGVNLIMICVF